MIGRLREDDVGGLVPELDGDAVEGARLAVLEERDDLRGELGVGPLLERVEGVDLLVAARRAAEAPRAILALGIRRLADEVEIGRARPTILAGDPRLAAGLALWDLVLAGRVEHTVFRPILFRLKKDHETS